MKSFSNNDNKSYFLIHIKIAYWDMKKSRNEIFLLSLILLANNGHLAS